MADLLTENGIKFNIDKYSFVVDRHKPLKHKNTTNITFEQINDLFNEFAQKFGQKRLEFLYKDTRDTISHCNTPLEDKSDKIFTLVQI